jgi:hypothetical protein
MNRLLDILRSDEEVKVIKQLTGPDAQRFLDSAQEVIGYIFRTIRNNPDRHRVGA